MLAFHIRSVFKFEFVKSELKMTHTVMELTGSRLWKAQVLINKILIQLTKKTVKAEKSYYFPPKIRIQGLEFVCFSGTTMRTSYKQMPCHSSSVDYVHLTHCSFLLNSTVREGVPQRPFNSSPALCEKALSTTIKDHE